MSEPDDLVCWTVLSERELLRRGARLRVLEQHVRLPDGREVTDYLRFVTVPYVTIYATTADGRVICERQYKHGPSRVVLTLPSGAIEENEAPLEAARRELLEETGFASDDWLSLPQTLTHSNALGGVCYSFMARNCRETALPQSGDLEEMRIELLSREKLLLATQDGSMPQSSDIATILHAFLTSGLLAA